MFVIKAFEKLPEVFVKLHHASQKAPELRKSLLSDTLIFIPV